LDGDVESREHFVGSSNNDLALILAESVIDNIDSLDDGDVEVDTWISQSAEFSKGGDDSCFHRRYKFEHLFLLLK